jgi:hypothetical protein
VLHADGTYEELPDAVAASIENDELICYNAQDRVVARQPSAGSLFGTMDAIRHLAVSFQRAPESKS